MLLPNSFIEESLRSSCPLFPRVQSQAVRRVSAACGQRGWSLPPSVEQSTPPASWDHPAMPSLHPLPGSPLSSPSSQHQNSKLCAHQASPPSLGDCPGLNRRVCEHGLIQKQGLGRRPQVQMRSRWGRVARIQRWGGRCVHRQTHGGCPVMIGQELAARQLLAEERPRHKWSTRC